MGIDRYKVSIKTGSSSVTVPPPHKNLPHLEVTPDTLDDLHIFSPARWRGRHVWVHGCTRKLDDPMWLACGSKMCAPYEHDLYPMTHFGLPTGFLTCRRCRGTAFDPEAYADAELEARVVSLTEDLSRDRGEAAVRAVVERYGRVWVKDETYYRAAAALGIKEPPDA